MLDAYQIYKVAFDEAKRSYPEATWTDGHGDAFRHAYWNALLTERFGEEWTASYTTAHERMSPGNAASAEAMDLHNNEVGRRIATENPGSSPEELAELVKQSVQDGEMVVIGPDRKLAYSDQVEVGKTGNTRGDPPGQGGFDPPEPGDYGTWSGGYNPGDDAEADGTTDATY